MGILYLVAASFTNTITLGSVILACMIAIGGLAVFVYGARWKSAYMVAEANAEAWSMTANRLQLEIDRLRGEVSLLQERLNELQSLPDLRSVIDAVLAHDSAQQKAWVRHDAHAEERNVRLIEAIRNNNPIGA